jgi:hypothetical protein
VQTSPKLSEYFISRTQPARAPTMATTATSSLRADSPLYKMRLTHNTRAKPRQFNLKAQPELVPLRC